MIVVTGAGGQLASEFQRLIPSAKFFSQADLDLTNAAAVRGELEKHDITTLINCAAYTAVDKSESELDLAWAINSEALWTLGKLSDERGFRIIHFSTDYVFNGESSEPLTEESAVDPIGAYGQSKRAGEVALLSETDHALVIRTAWVYSQFGANFLKTMLRVGAERPELNVVFDQIGTPTYAADLASAVMQILPRLTDETPNILNYTNEGIASWYDFAQAIFELKKMPVKVHPIRSSEYPTPAKRPAYSVLDKTLIKKTFGLEIPHWREGLKRCLELS